ncbi:glycosyltransferase [Roseovarius nubinhibens]|uniref:glycosyltransferase n=1 Tax=Roseovarius nubinhibens TaxID=314263 RepID=UPI001C082FFC|nr:glycosyltransferase [Roseovarius nubinhibens]MBU2999830.1 glycosyltransferase [Roseovarius nubinhibens]
MNKIVVGGIPSPIGGVTTFLRRLLHRDADKIDLLIDIYPGEKEEISHELLEKVIQLKGRFYLVPWLWRNLTSQRDAEVYFNFSTPKALIVLMLAPKLRRTRWSVMLHHGDLTAGPVLSMFLRILVLPRVDRFLVLSQGQKAFYDRVGVPEICQEWSTSYCEPVDHVDSAAALKEFSAIESRYPKVTVMSGFPNAIYNFEMAIDAFAELKDNQRALCIFIYGPGPLRSRLKALEKEHDWLFVFDERPEKDFNTFLRHCDLFMRLTTVDSMGIAVWDADYWGRKIVASDVCTRPSGASITQLNIESVRSVLLEQVC